MGHKMKINSVIAGIFLLFFNGLTFAGELYTGPAGGYPTDGLSYTNPPQRQEARTEKHDVMLSVTLPPDVDNSSAFTLLPKKHHHNPHDPAPQWVEMSQGDPMPGHAVIGGSQPDPEATLFVCRANYHGGVHPGKLFEGRCNIGWGGREISIDHYQVLVSRVPLAWVSASFGDIPHHAIEGGYQHDGPLYICQARLHGGIHVGKLYGENCNVAWGGREVLVPHYNVLVK
jgi:hypothetical protein